MATGAQLCREAEARLAAAGVPDPAGDVRHLFLHALNSAGPRPDPDPGLRPETGFRPETGPRPAPAPVRRHHLPDLMAQPVSAPVAAAFAVAIAARAARQPVSQITGRRAFWTHEFRVTPAVLDPRPETETLVEAALALPWRHVLDLGTGSGAILVSLLAARPGARGLGTDLSAAALAVARENAADTGVSADFLQSDWYGRVAGRFDLIVSNPPYIAEAEMPRLAPEVRDWEPRLALTDGADGLTAYRTICAGAPAHLAPGGHLLVEIGPTQGAAVAALMGAAGLSELRILPDLDRRDRVVCGKLSQSR